MTLLTRKRQVASKLESVEGVAESLLAADAKNLVWNPKIAFDVAMFKREPSRATLSNIGDIPGKRPGNLTFGLEVRGSGAAATAPDWSKNLKGMGCKVNTVRTINIGAITNGPFVHGETITGGTSGATGRVIMKTTTGTSPLYVVVLTGTFQSGEVLTGATSGATVTTTSTSTIVGNVIEPDSGNPPSLTMAGYQDGLVKNLRGCRGKGKLALKSGDPAMLDLDFMGVEAGVSDAALLSNPAYETTKPPSFLNANFSINGVALKTSEVEINFDNDVVPVDDIGSDRGISHFIISRRQSVGSFNTQMVLAATHDFHSLWFAGTEMVMDFSWGTVAGNKFRFYAPRVQYTKVEDEDVSGIAYAKCMFNLNGSLTPGDDEWALLCL